MWQRFTPRARRVVLLAHTEAQRSRVQLISTEHLLMGLLRLGDGVAVEALDMAGVDLDKLRSDLEERMEMGGIEETSRELSFTPDATQVLQLAYAESRHLGDAHIGTEHLLLGLLRLGKGPAYRTLQRYGLELRQTRHMMRELSESESGRSEEGRKSKTPHLDQFSRDLTELARRGKLDPVIGREPEIERIMQVLCRRTKNNPALIGDAGVGKTAIVEGLAQRITHSEVPDLLKGRRLVALDLASLVAGTKYRGEFEERMKRVMEEIRDSEGQIIIFLDELHAMVGTGAAEGAMDASNILKPALARGELQCIGASTLDEYRKYIEKTPSLERRFQPITIREPTDEQTMQILEGIKSRYEDFHRVCYMPDALEAAVQLSNRYIMDRAQPDKAIDLVDESGSRVKLRQYKMTTSVEALTQGLSEAEAEAATVVPDYEELQADYAEAPDKPAEEGEEVPYVYREDIGQVVSTWTGIPVVSLTQEESGRLLGMEEVIHEDVVGQDEAVNTVSRAVRRARAGIKDPRRPTGSFVFLGPTGVGKTLLARVLARFLFGDEDALIRIDMSEYMERFAVSRLTGAPPGYVGYEESGQLTEQVRRRPYCVVLFDEIEKAHP
ncbi:MAG: ATP-dependent Clp protease ATP-binding subunit, partial [Armatimonadetes bacterium]|nr:ATP-dependent Clp protease ATP-binding subunit [Armatimonadota bacterium]